MEETIIRRSRSTTDESKIPEEKAGRSVKWEYVIPIVFTPAAHICVSLINKYPKYKRPLFYGVIITSILTIQTRMILMYDAGYPGNEKKEEKKLSGFMRLLAIF